MSIGGCPLFYMHGYYFKAAIYSLKIFTLITLLTKQEADQF